MIEYNEAVQELIESLEDAAGERELTGNEKIFMDVVETVGVIFEDGLHEFWFSPVDQDAVIKSFDTIEAYEVVDLIQSSQWCTSTSSDRNDLNATESEHLAEIEEDIYIKLEDIPELLDAFVEEMEG